MKSELLQALAAKLTLADMQELIMRFSLNEAAEMLYSENKPITKTNLQYYINNLQAAGRMLNAQDMQRIEDVLITKYVRNGWKREANTNHRLVILTEQEANSLISKLA